MSGLALIALILLGFWLVVLTLVSILTVRQIGILTVRLSLADSSFSLADDGPTIGSLLPTEIMPALPHSGNQERIYLLLVSATCSPCRELAEGLSQFHFGPSIIALVAGRDEPAGDLIALLPVGFRIIRDPEASRFAKALQIQSTPFAVEIKDETVSGKAYLHNASDFADFVKVNNTLNPDEASQVVPGVSYAQQ